jgi:thiol-disulfide isomerase/thioredoxin
MKRTILADAITYFFIILFLYTGLAKLTETHLFKEQLISSPGLDWMAGIITWALPIGEILLAIALFIPAFRLKGLYVTLGVMSLFTIYVVSIFFLDNHLSCSCGGIIEELTPRQHIVFNSACVILSILGILAVRRQQPTSGFKWLTSGSAVCLFLLVGWTIFTAFSAPAKVKTGLEGRELPAFNLLLLDSTSRFNTADIAAGQPFIVFGFSPTCKHCQAETKDIIEHMDQLKNIKVYFVTGDKFTDMKMFYRYFNLARFPDIVMGRDEKFTFFKTFKVATIPFAAIFDSHKRLIEAFPYQTTAMQLVQVVKE